MDKKLSEQIDQLADQNKFREIIALIEQIPESGRDRETVGAYVRALNNTQQPALAAEVSLQYQDRDGDDPWWLYRLAYAYDALKRHDEAEALLLRAKGLAAGDAQLAQLAEWIDELLGWAAGGNAGIKAPLYHCPECGREISFMGMCYYCRSKAEQKRYQEMPDEEVARTVQEIIGGIETICEWDKVHNDFRHLLACRDINTEAIAAAAFAKEIYYPSELYRDASADVRDGIIRLLQEPDCKCAGHLLSCLARIGGEVAAEAVKKLDENPPPWQKMLYWSASQYMMCGDLCIDSDGKLVSLAYDQCYALLPGEGQAQDVSTAAASPREDVCPQCGCRLTDILVIDGRDKRLAFLGIDGKLRIPICPNCASMCDKTIVRYSLDGNASTELIGAYVEENYLSEGQYAELSGKQFVLAKEPSPPYFQLCPADVFTIGGHPEWVQDPQYEDCPDCGRKMKLLAQMSWNALMEYTEGSLFMLICTDCHVVTIVHQQT
jgi:hypothetical protein